MSPRGASGAPQLSPIAAALPACTPGRSARFHPAARGFAESLARARERWQNCRFRRCLGAFRSPASSCWAREGKVGSPHVLHLRCPSKWNYDGCQTPSPVPPHGTRAKFPARALQGAGKSGQRGLSPGSGYGGVSHGWRPPTRNCSPVTRTGPGSPPVATPGAAAEPCTSSP